MFQLLAQQVRDSLEKDTSESNVNSSKKVRHWFKIIMNFHLLIVTKSPVLDSSKMAEFSQAQDV